ncbi:MAG: hypothetical protein KDD60_09625, partial [Bdellovibrionales bacterium]|nr:hypothetical protein [Bdellovibrionales bacterium]
CRQLIAFGCFWRAVCVFPPSSAEASVDQTAKGATKHWRSGLGDFRPSPTEVGYGRRWPDIFNVLQYKLGEALMKFWELISIES